MLQPSSKARNVAQVAMKIRDKFIQEAVVTVTHTQGASGICGNQWVPTARQVSFDDKPKIEAPSTDMDLLHGVVRQLQQFAVTGKVTHTSDCLLHLPITVMCNEEQGYSPML